MRLSLPTCLPRRHAACPGRSSRLVVDDCGSMTMRVAKRRRTSATWLGRGRCRRVPWVECRKSGRSSICASASQRGLRLQRLRRRLTQGELAKVVRSSQSRVAKMEVGDPSVSIHLLVRSLIALGASNSDLARIISARIPAQGWGEGFHARVTEVPVPYWWPCQPDGVLARCPPENNPGRTGNGSCEISCRPARRLPRRTFRAAGRLRWWKRGRLFVRRRIRRRHGRRRWADPTSPGRQD